MDEKEQSVEIGTDKSEETLLTQWQTCVEMANAVSQRRDAMNNLFVTLNLAIVAAASFIWDAKPLCCSCPASLSASFGFSLSEISEN